MAAKISKETGIRVLSALLALGVWQLAAVLIGNRLLLAGPVAVMLRLLALLPAREFWQALGFTFTRITGGFLAAFFLALLLAVPAARHSVAAALIRPYMVTVQTVPVASFIVLALFWLSGRRLGGFIAFLMVLPVLYHAGLAGLQAADRQLLEMAQVFRMPLYNRIRCIYAPALRPYLVSGCRTALGLCWKAGVAAEVIGLTRGSIGGMLYQAKIYLEIPDLFAWTLVVVAVSVGFGKLFLAVLDMGFRLLEGRGWN